VLIDPKAASHSNKGWEQFTAAVLRVVTSRTAPSSSVEEKVTGASGVVVMAWGAHAQKMCAGVDKVCSELLRRLSGEDELNR